MIESATRLMAITILALLAFSGLAQAQESESIPYQEGLHYFEIEHAPAGPPKRIVLTEFFSYLCTHCNTFDPYIEAWAKKRPPHVDFERLPVVFGRDSWELYARGYVTSNMMNVPDEAHVALMDRLWKQKKILRNMDEIADFYSGFGLDKEKFLSTSRSFAVDGKIRKDQQLVTTYGIRGTPALVVNGKYRIQGNAAVPSFEVMLDVVDYLIEQETAKMQVAAERTGTATESAEMASADPAGEGH